MRGGVRRPVFHTVISRTVKFPETRWPASRSPRTRRPRARRRPTAQLARRGHRALGDRPTARPVPPHRAGGRGVRSYTVDADAGDCASPPMTRRRPPTRCRRRTPAAGFPSALDDFEGPFDLLLPLIAKHKLDVTELALPHGHRRVHRLHPGPGRAAGTSRGHRVPGRRRDPARPEGRPAAAAGRGGGRGGPRPARGPRPAVRPPAAVPRVQGGRRPSSATPASDQARRYPRPVGLEPRFAGLLPEVMIDVGPEQFAADRRARAGAQGAAAVSLAHLHAAAGLACASRRPCIVDRLQRRAGR